MAIYGLEIVYMEFETGALSNRPRFVRPLHGPGLPAFESGLLDLTSYSHLMVSLFSGAVWLARKIFRFNQTAPWLFGSS
jgi:hypothetical protein